MKKQEINSEGRFAYKGFDKNLSCRNHSFKIGEVYSMEEKPSLCQRGFHFCDSLPEVFAYYPEKGSRFCIVEIMGDVDAGKGKSATNKIRIVREIEPMERASAIEGFNLDMILSVNKHGGLLGGSTALKLQGFDLGRKMKDLDFILPNRGAADKVFKGLPKAAIGDYERENNDNFVSYYDKSYGCVYDVFINPRMEPYHTVSFYGEDIKIADALYIWKHKLGFAFEGSVKHMQDFKKYNNKVTFDIIVKYK